MTSRRHQIAALARLQQAERDAAAGEAAVARAAADVAATAADRLAADTQALAIRWTDAMAGGRFEPEVGALLGRAVIAADAAAIAGRREARSAAARHDVTVERWQLADARVEATARVARSLARAAGRAADEASLAATEDRIAARGRRR